MVPAVEKVCEVVVEVVCEVEKLVCCCCGKPSGEFKLEVKSLGGAA